MSREDLDRFLTDESRAKVNRFMAESADEDDNVDMDKVVRQYLADHAAALHGDAGTSTGKPISPERLAQIREEVGPRSVYLSGVAGDGLVVMANELLDEIDRLADVLRANSVVRNAAESSCRVYKACFEKVRRERDEERAEVKRLAKRADLLEGSLDGMRQQAVEAVKERNAATAQAKTAEAALERVRRHAQHPRASSGLIRDFVYAADVLALIDQQETT